MATPTTETTTEQASAPAVEQDPAATEQSSSDSAVSSTKQLFPDFFVKDDEGNPQVTSQRQDMDAEKSAEGETEAPKPEAHQTEPKTPEPKAPEYLDVSQISGKKVRVKVDGVEMDVPAEDLIKNYQLDRHLTQRGQSLAEKEKELKALNTELRTVMDENAGTPKPSSTPAGSDPRIDAILKKIDDVERSIKPIATKDQVDQGLEKLDRAVRDNLGFEDFRDKIPDIRTEIAKNFKDPNNPSEDELAKWDTLAAWYQGYQTVKLREVKSAAKPVPPVPAPAAKTGPVLQKKPVTPPAAVEESGGASSDNGDQVSQWKVRYDRALDEARKSGTDEAWQRVFSLKRQRPDS